MAYSNKVKETSNYKSFPRGLKDGVNRRRVLPGIHTCSEDGTWAKKYSTHTYRVPHKDDPEKNDYHTFHCQEVINWVNREKVVLETCDECLLIAEKDADYNRLKIKLTEELKSGLRTKDEVTKLLRPFIEFKKRHSRSFWWAVNVLDSEGKFFTDKWPNDVKKLFDAIKKKAKDEEGIGAILPIEQGLWVDIIKIPSTETGTGFPKYQVEVVMERQSDGSKREKQAPLPPESADEAEKSCRDLNDPGIITLTREQVKQLATSGDAPEILQGIFNQSVKTTKPNDTEEILSVEKPTTKTEEVETPSMPAVVDEVESEDDRIYREAEVALLKAAAKREEKRSAAKVTAVTTPPVSMGIKTEPKVEVKSKEVIATENAKNTNNDNDIDNFMKEFSLSNE